MKLENVRFGRGFKVLLGNRRGQPAQMVIAPGASEDGPANRHRGSDQWLCVQAGREWPSSRAVTTCWCGMLWFWSSMVSITKSAVPAVPPEDAQLLFAACLYEGRQRAAAGKGSLTSCHDGLQT
jgi:hypothetical protein